MARTRQLKPDFFQDEDLSSRSMAARLLFAGLWTLADRQGRLEDRPLRIKAVLFPYDAVDVDALLSELAKPKEHVDGALITRYEVDGRRYIRVDTFEKHQHCHPAEPKSSIPGPIGENSPAPVPVGGVHARSQAAWAIALSGRRNVKVPSGLCDIVTSTHAIEVKPFYDWKHAIGQALCYAVDLGLKPAIIIYGTGKQPKVTRMRQEAQRMGVLAVMGDPTLENVSQFQKLAQHGILTGEPSVPSESVPSGPSESSPTGPSGPSESAPSRAATAAPVGALVKPKPVKPSWSREACDDWVDRFDGSPPGDRIGSGLSPLVKRHGWETVRPAWRRYLAEKDPEFASAQDFAAKYGQWAVAPAAGTGVAIQARGSPGAQSKARFAADRIDEKVTETMEQAKVAKFFEGGGGS